MHSSKFLFACVALGLALTSKTASAQTLNLISPTVNDGGFESITGKSNFVSSTSANANIPYWGATLVNAAGATVVTPPDSGAEMGAPSAGNDNRPTHTGNAGAFWQPGGTSTAFNLVTSRAMVAGDVYNLSWFGRFTGNGGAQVASLFSQLASTATGATYTYQPSATLTTLDTTDPNNFLIGTFSQYFLTYTATADDAGKFIGLMYGNSGTAYIAADDFVLTVTPAAAPEPSTYALLFAGLGGVFVVRRLRRASV